MNDTSSSTITFLVVATNWRRLARRVALLVSVLTVLVAPHLKAQTSVSYPAGSGTGCMAFDGTNIWVTNALGNGVPPMGPVPPLGTVTKLLAATGVIVGTYSVGSFPAGIAFDGTNIWVTNGFDNTVTKLLASTGATVGTYSLGALPTIPGGIAFDGTNMWIASETGVVIKLRASSGAIVGTYPVGNGVVGDVNPALSILFDGTNIWVSSGKGLIKMVVSTGAIVGTYPAAVVYPLEEASCNLAFDGTNIWTTGWNGVIKLLASTGAVVGIYPAGNDSQGLAFDGTNIWVANNGGSVGPDFEGTVTVLRAADGATVGTYPVGGNPSGVVFGGSSIWVSDDDGVAKFGPVGQQAPSISPAGIVPLYSTTTTIQPGEWVSIYGTNLASSAVTWTGNFPASLGGTSVTVNGKSAYLWFVSPTQINMQAPNDTTTGSIPVVVTTASGTFTSTVTLAQFAPSFSLLDGKHVTGIILRSNGSGTYGGGSYDVLGPTGRSLGYATVAAKAGDTVELFAVGLGPTNPAVLAGRVFSGSAPTTNSVNLLINNVNVIPTFAGLSSAGLYQINLIVPSGLGTGDVSLMATVGGARTPSGVTISLQ